MSSISPSQASLRGRLAAHTLHSLYDSRELTAPARAAFEQRFLDEVDPNRVLPEAERERRAAHALKAHMTRLALRSAQARRRRTASDAASDPSDTVSQVRQSQGEDGIR